MTEDEVVREVRAAREAFAASHGYDIRAMVAALREVGLASGREVVRLPPRPAQRPNQTPQPTGATKLVSGTSSPPVATPAADL
jgi:hypothetical protein